MRKLALFLLLFLFSHAFSALILFEKVDVDFPEDLYKTVGTRSFLVKYFTLFESEEQRGLILSGWIFSPTDQASTTVEIRVESGNEFHVFKVETEKEGFYSVIPPCLLIVPKGAKIFLGKYEIGGDIVD
ncbi:hypothetical protein [Thermotoga sp. SG1]|uniref:hypothetical protein n=1 Tax=Thermotoga sp. SG1 TaxID=126739 RepID=UPI000C78C44E|nr:hypothetical protein [Thermotoga sp. SG1]PLV55814.1 hypothetical protein AS006_09310 [Thermotoga sp. SG1]